MHELARRGAIRSRMHSDPQCRVNVLLQQVKARRWGVISSNAMDILCPPTHPPSVSMSTRISLERTPRFSIDSVLMNQLSTYFSPLLDADYTGFSNGPAIAH
jgi:hypothetical protein